MKKNFALAVLEQSAVSGGNFATIAICSHLLDPIRQGQFLYGYAAYVALLTLNIALFFTAAPSVNAQTTQQDLYTRYLSTFGLRFWFGSSLATIALFWFLGPSLNWQPTLFEALAFASFLLTQQGADFLRRLGYLRQITRRVTINSLVLYSSRLLLLWLVAPNSVASVFITLSISALPFLVMACPIQGKVTREMLSPTAIQLHWQLTRWALLTTPMAWWFSYAPLYFLGAQASASTAAIFGNIRSLTGAANIVMELLETAIPVWLAKQFVQTNVKEVRRSTGWVLLIGFFTWGLGLAVLWLIGEGLLALLFGESYRSAFHWLLLGWGGVLTYFLNRTIQVYFKAQGFLKAELFGTLCATLGMTGFLIISTPIDLTEIFIAYVTVPLLALFSQIIYAHYFKPVP